MAGHCSDGHLSGTIDTTCERNFLSDLVEGGFSREVVSDRMMSPSPRRNTWQFFKVVRSEDKHTLTMTTRKEGKFVLCAKRIGDIWKISQYEEYSKASGENAGRYCAIVKMDPRLANSKSRKYRRNFILQSRSCEYCDNYLKKFICGGPGELSDSEGRQILAKISHCASIIKGTEIDARLVNLRIPPLTRVGEDYVRQGWCARVPCNDGTIPSFKSKLPVWSAEHNTLTLQFLHRHITHASSKNTLLIDENGSPCLQFGKAGARTFVLDVQHPVSPVQAFAVALTQFLWAGCR